MVKKRNRLRANMHITPAITNLLDDIVAMDADVPSVNHLIKDALFMILKDKYHVPAKLIRPLGENLRRPSITREVILTFFLDNPRGEYTTEKLMDYFYNGLEDLSSTNFLTTINSLIAADYIHFTKVPIQVTSNKTVKVYSANKRQKKNVYAASMDRPRKYKAYLVDSENDRARVAALKVYPKTTVPPLLIYDLVKKHNLLAVHEIIKLSGLKKNLIIHRCNKMVEMGYLRVSEKIISGVTKIKKVYTYTAIFDSMLQLGGKKLTSKEIMSGMGQKTRARHNITRRLNEMLEKGFITESTKKIYFDVSNDTLFKRLYTLNIDHPTIETWLNKTVLTTFELDFLDTVESAPDGEMEVKISNVTRKLLKRMVRFGFIDVELNVGAQMAKVVYKTRSLFVRRKIIKLPPIQK